MPIPRIVSERDALRHAVAWLAEQGTPTTSLIEEACQRFDLSQDEDFLLREFRREQMRQER
jgi:hypothetical protein